MSPLHHIRIPLAEPPPCCRRWRRTWRVCLGSWTIWFCLVSIGLPLPAPMHAACAAPPGQSCRCAARERAAGTCCCRRDAVPESKAAAVPAQQRPVASDGVETNDPRHTEDFAAVEGATCCSQRVAGRSDQRSSSPLSPTGSAASLSPKTCRTAGAAAGELSRSRAVAGVPRQTESSTPARRKAPCCSQEVRAATAPSMPEDACASISGCGCGADPLPGWVQLQEPRVTSAEDLAVRRPLALNLLVLLDDRLAGIPAAPPVPPPRTPTSENVVASWEVSA